MNNVRGTALVITVAIAGDVSFQTGFSVPQVQPIYYTHAGLATINVTPPANGPSHYVLSIMPAGGDAASVNATVIVSAGNQQEDLVNPADGTASTPTAFALDMNENNFIQINFP